MFDFTTNIIFIISLSVIVYILARALPRVPDEVVPASAFDKLVERLPLEQVDNALVSTFEKILRKVRVLVMKIDNVINKNLDQLRKHSPALKEKQSAVLKEKMEAMADAVSDDSNKK